MFVLGFVLDARSRADDTENFLKLKFKGKDALIHANMKVLKGYSFGDTMEAFSGRTSVDKAEMEPGTYRSIMGNQATALGSIAASQKSGLQLFYGPIRYTCF